jgi:hypothetical protein
LPSSKYASPADTRLRESHPHEPPSAEFEPVILPGESLSIFKDRVPSASAAPPAGHSSFGAGTSTAQTAPRKFTDEELSAGLPGSLFATPSAAIPEEHETPFAEVKAEPFTGIPKYAATSPAAETEIARDVEKPLNRGLRS